MIASTVLAAANPDLSAGELVGGLAIISIVAFGTGAVIYGIGAALGGGSHAAGHVIAEHSDPTRVEVKQLAAALGPLETRVGQFQQRGINTLTAPEAEEYLSVLREAATQTNSLAQTVAARGEVSLADECVDNLAHYAAQEVQVLVGLPAAWKRYAELPDTPELAQATADAVERMRWSA